MSLYEFEIQSLWGAERVLVDGDCNLEMPAFDLDYEQAMLEFDGWENASAALTLWTSWDRLIECIQESTGQTEDLAWMMSWCQRLFDDKYFKEIVFLEDKIWTYQLISTLCDFFRLAFLAFDKPFCKNILTILKRVKKYNESWSDDYKFYIDGEEPKESTVSNIDEWTIEGYEERFLMFERNVLIGPWYRYIGKTITDIFDFGYHDYEFDGPRASAKEQVLLRDQIISELDLYDRVPRPLPYNLEAYIPQQADPKECVNFALIYLSRGDLENAPYSNKHEIAIRYYRTEPMLIEAFRLASKIDAKHGGFYDIRMLKRISYSERVCEQWRERELHEHQKMGAFLDWVAQNWQEIIPE